LSKVTAAAYRSPRCSRHAAPLNAMLVAGESGSTVHATCAALGLGGPDGERASIASHSSSLTNLSPWLEV
jgi:hypothetical protein